MPLQQTSGNVTADAYGGGVAAKPNYIEDVFSTYLYTSASSSQTIVNNIDLSTKGGLVWIKSRSNATSNELFDTARGASNVLTTNTTDAQASYTDEFGPFTTTGFTVPQNLTGPGGTNFGSGRTYASWTFRKQPKFFDVVTYTGTGSVRTVSHNLGSAPGCIIVKCTSSAGFGWVVYHKSLGNTQYMQLNLTNAAATNSVFWNNTDPTATNFTVGTASGVNNSGDTFVAYLFADNAGGFGLTGTDNVISCGTFTTDASQNATVNLGYEPQFVITKRVDAASGWNMMDTMRGMSQTSLSYLQSNSSNAETSFTSGYLTPTATGFTTTVPGLYAISGTYIYIAIRRGPMKVPTDATKVFAPVATTADSSTTTGYPVTAGFPVDLSIFQFRNASFGSSVGDRLRGLPKAPSASNTPTMYTYSTSSESGSADQFGGDNMTGIRNYGYGAAYNLVNWMWRRAPSFFDEVCYTGTGAGGSPNNVPHNLGAVPELMIVKRRTFSGNWAVYSLSTGNSNYLLLNTTDASAASSTVWNNTTPTSSVFTVGNNGLGNSSGEGYVAYLFATCAGVSKVGSYTGNGTTQTINCGFTGGARFVLIKRTDDVGSWYVYDTARGMTTLTDPYLLLNSTAAESATLGSVTTVSTGFAVNASILAAINTNGASYIFFSVA